MIRRFRSAPSSAIVFRPVCSKSPRAKTRFQGVRRFRPGRRFSPHWRGSPRPNALSSARTSRDRDESWIKRRTIDSRSFVARISKLKPSCSAVPVRGTINSTKSAVGMQLPNSLPIDRAALSGEVASIAQQLRSAERAWLGVYLTGEIRSRALAARSVPTVQWHAAFYEERPHHRNWAPYV